MSHQPSSINSLKSTASSAYDTVSSTVSQTDPDYDEKKDKTNFTKDVHGNKAKKGGFKDKLNEAVMGRSIEGEESIVEKSTWYIQSEE
jgi:hypothetical protein